MRPKLVPDSLIVELFFDTLKGQAIDETDEGKHNETQIHNY